jgi:rubrerythrin
MTISFNPDEILQMAEVIEENGFNFYTKAASVFPPHADLFGALAQQERAHLECFKKLRAALSAAEKVSTSYDPDNQSALFLKAMADSRIFNIRNSFNEVLTGKETLSDIFKAALDKEKDSIAFYVGLKELVPSDTGKEKVDQIIKEELRHIAVIQMAFNQLGN